MPIGASPSAPQLAVPLNRKPVPHHRASHVHVRCKAFQHPLPIVIGIYFPAIDCFPGRQRAQMISRGEWIARGALASLAVAR